MSDIVKKPDSSTGLALNKGKFKSTTSGFQQRVKKAQQETIDPMTMPNRIVLMLDSSGSMNDLEQNGKRRIDLLKDAVENFVQRTNVADTSLAVETFPPSVSLPLTSNKVILQTSTYGLSAGGGTPMRACVQLVLDKIPMTRGIIVSDGQATDWRDSYGEETNVDEILQRYKEAGIPIDCVHISLTSSGEDLLRKIASVTGGIFIKFTDVGAFATAFGYLAPGFRAMLTDGRLTASDIGAKEVQP